MRGGGGDVGMGGGGGVGYFGPEIDISLFFFGQKCVKTIIN